MSCYSSLLNSCPNIQEDVNVFWNNCVAGPFKESLPQLEFLLSPENRSGIAVTVNPSGGKLRKYDVRYTKRLLESQVSHIVANPTCTSDVIVPDCIHTYEIDATDNYSAARSFSAADLLYSCENDADYFNKVMMALIDVVERKMATIIAQESIGELGTWASDVKDVNDANPSTTGNYLVVKTKNDASIDLYPDTFELMDLANLKTGYCTPAVIFASDKLFSYYRKMEAACCAASGQDLAKVFDLYGKTGVIWDRRIQTAYGNSNNNLQVALGALQLLTYNVSGWKDGMPAEMGATYHQFKIFSPRSGIPMDVLVNDVCGVITIRVWVDAHVVSMPSDMFQAGDVFEGVTYVNGIRVTNV